MLKNQKPGKQPAKPAPIEKKKVNKVVKNALPAWQTWGVAIALFIITLITFSNSFNNELTNWDDPDYIIENPLIRNLNSETVKEIFTKPYFGNYQPLHILSYAIEFQYFGLKNPGGYHKVSVVMFAISVMLLFYFILLLTENNLIVAIATALLYALNPMKVESVAWAAERKDMLYSMFFIAALIFYLLYLKKNFAWHYLAIAFILFIISLFSKVMAVTFVGVAVMLDYWFSRKIDARLLIEKLLFIIPSIIIGIVQVKSVDASGTIAKSGLHTFYDKIGITCHNLLQYIFKLLVPIKLSNFYPYPSLLPGQLPLDFYIAPVVVAILAGLVIWSMKHTKIFFFCGGIFVATIVLVLQYVPVGPTMFSERYSLVPSIGLCFLIAYGINFLISKKKELKVPLLAIVGIYCAVLAYATAQRCDVWQNSLTLWNNCLEQFPTVSTALNNRGKYYGQTLNDLVSAERDLNASIKYDPNYELAYSNRGIVYSIQGKFEQALSDFNMAIKLKPDYKEAMHNRAIALAQMKRFDESLKDLNYLISKWPGGAENYQTRGMTLLQLNKSQEGLNDLNKALQINPELLSGYTGRVQAYYQLGRYNDARRELQYCQQIGAQINPEFAKQVMNAPNQ